MQAGNFSIALLIGGRAIQNSPWQMGIAAGPMSAGVSAIGGPDLFGCIAATDCFLHITARDMWGNARLAGDDGLVVRAPNGTADVVAFDGDSGIYKVSGGGSDGWGGGLLSIPAMR